MMQAQRSRLLKGGAFSYRALPREGIWERNRLGKGQFLSMVTLVGLVKSCEGHLSKQHILHNPGGF